MNRRLSWLPAAIPATLLGHGVCYALTGRVQSDGHHAYLVPALQYSAFLVASLCVLRLYSALGAEKVRSRLLRLDELWLRLSFAQILLYVTVESLEGFSISAVALVAQIAVALLAALALAGFSRLVSRCEQAAIDGSRYVARCTATPLHIFFNDRSPAYALRIAAGTARFQRPPPHR